MKNKKAILLPESIRIIIAVLCIILLIYLAVSLYGLFKNKTEREQARETLKQIIDEITTAKDTGKERQYLVIAPKGWYLVSYVKEKSTPTICKGESCLCMCPEKSNILDVYGKIEGDIDQTDYFYKEGFQKCQDERICQNVEDKIEFGDLASQILEKTIGTATIRKRVNFIPFLELPKVIYINKEDEGISLSVKSEEATHIILDGLFAREIEFNQEKINFQEFISTYMTKDCTDENFEPSSETKDFSEKEIKEYLKGLQFDKKVGGLNINIQKIKNNIEEILVKPWVYRNYDIPQSKTVLEREELILCENQEKNLIFVIEYSGSFEETK